jgi:hypothetical protein
MPPFGKCAKAPGRTVLSTARGRVYKTSGVDEMWRQRWAYACLFGGRAIALGASPGGEAAIDGAVQKFRLAGHAAALGTGIERMGDPRLRRSILRPPCEVWIADRAGKLRDPAMESSGVVGPERRPRDLDPPRRPPLRLDRRTAINVRY